MESKMVKTLSRAAFAWYAPSVVATSQIIRVCFTVAFLVAINGCAKKKKQEVQRAPQAQAPKNHKQANRAKELYDDKGHLRESGKSISGLPLPVALEETISEKRRHVYRTHVPIEKVLQFFAPKLFTAQVDRHGKGAVYRNAKVLRSKSPLTLDVSVLPIAGRKTRVEIREIPPKSANIPKPTPILEQSVREHFSMYD